MKRERESDKNYRMLVILNVILIIIVIGLLIYSFAPQLFDKDIRLAPAGDCKGTLFPTFFGVFCVFGETDNINPVSIWINRSFIDHTNTLNIKVGDPGGLRISGLNWKVPPGSFPTEVPTNVEVHGKLKVSDYLDVKYNHLLYNDSAGDRSFVALRPPESYILRFTNFIQSDGINKTTVEKLTEGNVWQQACGEKTDSGGTISDCNIGSVTLSFNKIVGKTDKVVDFNVSRGLEGTILMKAG